MTARRDDSLKRSVDLVAATVGLILLMPALAVVAMLVWITMGRPVLFRQARAGLHARAFTMVKFRTMRDLDLRRGLVTDGDRLTPMGRALRRVSLDELPTLWNVVLGQMSLVGPRPLPVRYLDRYSPRQARRHEVRPGVTGLAQVRGRNLLGWDERLALDTWYVEHRSLAMDARIAAETVRVVLRRDGISADGEATMSEFLGTSVTQGDRVTS
jgi:lipopolysaccharide/colanic/teichoic acid biosynthesis glycosyltransferase